MADKQTKGSFQQGTAEAKPKEGRHISSLADLARRQKALDNKGAEIEKERANLVREGRELAALERAAGVVAEMKNKCPDGMKVFQNTAGRENVVLGARVYRPGEVFIAKGIPESQKHLVREC